MEKKPDTARTIIDSAERLFAQQGYDATCVDQIARAAGVTKGAVYYFFKSKAELFCAVVDPGIDYIERQGELIMNQAQSSEAAARSMIEMCVDIAYDNRRMLSMMFGGRSADPEVRRMIDLRIGRILAWIERIVSAGIQSGLIPPSDPAALSHIFAGLIYGSAVLPGAPDRKTAFETTFALLRDGLFSAGRREENP